MISVMLQRRVKDNIINMINNRRIEEAKVLIDEYTAKVQGDPEVYSIKANINIAENNIDEAEKLLSEGIKSSPNNLDLMYKLAYLYENTKLKCLPLALNYYRRCFDIATDEGLKEKIKVSIDTIEKELIILTDDKKPLVSIVVLAHNQLKYTRLCIESIYKYTSHINFELITVNNASSDGTDNYFNSLPNTKKIKTVKDVGSVDGFNAGIECAEGKYVVLIGNGFILTEKWINNLLTCIESDEFIGMVSPGSNIASNYQEIECKYNSIDAMQEFARNYNESDPKKWEQRLKISSSVSMFRTDLLRSIHGYDPSFYYGELCDEDISIRIRRYGYKLIYAADTFVHKNGEKIAEKENIEKRTLEASKKIFFDKYNIGTISELTFNSQIVKLIDYKVTDNVNILGINTFCGGTPLQIKNKLKSIGVEKIKIVSLTEDQKYIEDLKAVSDEIYFSPIEKLESYIIGKTFDFIIYEGGIDYADDIGQVLVILKKYLKKEGKLIFNINNKAYYGNLFYYDDYEQTLYSRGNKLSYLGIQKVVDMLSKNNFNNIKVDRYIPPYREEIVNNLIASFSARERDQFKTNIVTTKFIISCNL